MTTTEKDPKDPNDPVRISIFVPFDEDNEDWVYDKLDTLKEYDPGFYYRELDTKNGTMFIIDTKVKNMEHQDFKKFLFQARIKFAENVKIR
jgi:hypothetical protein